MNQEEAIQRLHAITAGIDKDGAAEAGNPGGWWETSRQAEVGRHKLTELEELIRALTE